MRYFFYLSATKVNNLFAQIPKSRWKSIAAEVGFDVGLFSAKISGSPALNRDEGDYQKLLAVIRHLKSNSILGSIDAPNDWVADETDAKMVLLEEGKHVVLFSGITAAGTAFALGGSAANVVGTPPSSKLEIGWSFLPSLLQSLQRYERILEQGGLNAASTGAVIEQGTQRDQQEWMDLVQTVQKNAPAPHVRVGFLAKRLLSGTHPYNGKKVLLATPVYVEQLG